MWTGGFAGMDRRAQPLAGRTRVDIAKSDRVPHDARRPPSPMPTMASLVSRSLRVSSSTRSAASTPKWRTASKIQYSDMPKSRSPRRSARVETLKQRRRTHLRASAMPPPNIYLGM